MDTQLESIDLSLNFTQEELERMGKIAQSLGYSALKDYMLDLIPEDDTNEAILNRIEQGFLQALRGEGTPIHEVLELLDDDDR
jgi:hypothetical protein